MKAWFRALTHWLEYGDWPTPDGDHWCGACAIGQLLEDYHRRQSPLRETCDLTDEDLATFDEIRRGYDLRSKR